MYTGRWNDWILVCLYKGSLSLFDINEEYRIIEKALLHSTIFFIWKIAWITIPTWIDNWNNSDLKNSNYFCNILIRRDQKNYK